MTNILKEVVTNIVTVKPQPTPSTIKSKPTLTNVVHASLQNVIIEKAIREQLNKLAGELGECDEA